MQISFNKGKNFYSIDDNASIKDITEILSRLNQKTWNSIVSKMDNKIVESFGKYNCACKELNAEAFKMEVSSRIPNSTLDNILEERINRFNILKKYLFYYQKETGNNKFIL